jgi:hypothetical protein
MSGIEASDIKMYNSKSTAAADGESSPDGLGGYRSSVVITDDEFENLFDNVGSAESDTGDTEYRAFFFRNEHLTLTLEAARVFLYTGVPMTDLTTGLIEGGSETTLYVTSNADFPDYGAVFVEDEEIRYTGKNSTTELTGCTRGSNSTTKAAHAIGTKVEHHKISFATEDPGTPNTNPIQTIANESTAPSGVSWSQAQTYTDGQVIGDLAPDEKYGVWIKRQVPLGCGPKATIYITIKIQGDTQE